MARSRKRSIVKKVLVGTGIAGGLAAAGILGKPYAKRAIRYYGPAWHRGQAYKFRGGRPRLRRTPLN